MVVAFLDLLGFSELLRKNQDAAVNKIVYISNTVCSDMFNDFISISDSLIITSNGPDKFVRTISSLLSEWFTQSMNNYSFPYNLETVSQKEYLTEPILKINSSYISDIPILFRGGVANGNDIIITNNIAIINEHISSIVNITGKTYLNAVELEKSGKGPHLFCNKDFEQSLKDKKCIRSYNKELGIYEIVWSYWGCEIPPGNPNHRENVKSALSNMLIPALNLYVYHRSYNPDFLIYYKELVEIVCRGILKYDLDHCGNENYSSQKIMEEFTKRKISISEIGNFLDLN